MATSVYQLNTQKAVSETVDGESIIINLETGNYYSLNPVGSALWNLAIAQHSLGVISQACAEHYGISEEESEKQIKSFLETLVDEGLLIPANTQSSVDTLGWLDTSKVFAPPVFEKYDDMQEMLLADPIHDVNESGWPILKKDNVIE